MKEAIESDGISQNQAADLHGVPLSTLKDRLSGRVLHGTNPGPQPYLSSEEDSELAAYFVELKRVMVLQWMSLVLWRAVPLVFQ